MSERQNNRNRKSRGRNSNSGQKQQNQPKKRSRNRQKKVDPAVFWGDPAKLPEPDHYVTSTPDTLAVVRSLGDAPIPGKSADPYFALVYDRAAGLATVLGHAGGLDDMTPLDPPVDLDDDDEDGSDDAGDDEHAGDDEDDDDGDDSADEGDD